MDRQREDAGARGAGTLGARVRMLRRAAGMTQTELAGGRFSKEYVSQIERGATQPTSDTLAWLADRLGTELEYLERGVSSRDEARIDGTLRHAEALLESRRYEDARRSFEEAGELIGSADAPRLSFRLATGTAWAYLRAGDLDSAMAVLEGAADLSVRAGFTDVDRAEVVYMIGVVRTMQSKIADALVLLDEALVLAEGSGLPSDRLRSDILQWRARCHRWNRDWVAAEEDGDRALELAEACSDPRRTADALFQASLVAQRRGRWVLSRTFAERSRELFAELGDRATCARLSNNLAGLAHLLGDAERALSLLAEAFTAFVDLDLPVDAGYVCSSLAAVRLDLGDAETAESQARRALSLLDGRADHLQEVGTAQVTLGRALASQGRLEEAERWIAAADETFERARSVSHRSSAWMAGGDLHARRGDHGAAADLYRRAALALLDPDPRAEDPA